MKLLICKDEKEWTDQINIWLKSRVSKIMKPRVFIPAGETPRPLYKDWQIKKYDFLKSIAFIQLDEILTAQNGLEFKNFFIRELPDFQSQIHYLDAGDDYGDLAILGLGLNGHLAFHEPGIPDSLYSGCVMLSKMTCERLRLPIPSWGVTYGLEAFMRTRGVLLVVRGEGKRQILNQVISGVKGIPASKLLEHQDLTIICDFPI